MHDAPYLRPTALDDALNALTSGAFRIAAGCTDLFPATARQRLPGPLLDITAIDGLRGIWHSDTGLRIGAATTWTDLIKADLPPACAGLQLAAREVGAIQIQNRGTIGGNLCNASPAADGVPPLLTLDAEVELSSARGLRRLALHDFLLGPRHTARAPDELLTAILIPNTSLGGQGHFLKLGARKYLVISITMCAARIEVEDGKIIAAALSLGACSPVATRLPVAEQALVAGQPITDAMITSALSPIDDVRADAAYRARAAAELVRRTVGGAK